jgi:hypothetical protein
MGLREQRLLINCRRLLKLDDPRHLQQSVSTAKAAAQKAQNTVRVSAACFMQTPLRAKRAARRLRQPRRAVVCGVADSTPKTAGLELYYGKFFVFPAVIVFRQCLIDNAFTF